VVLALDLEPGRELVELLTAHTVMYAQLISSWKAFACRPVAAGRSGVMMARLAGLNLRQPGSCTWPASTAFVCFIDLVE
jgi:hypothetical protein